MKLVFTNNEEITVTDVNESYVERDAEDKRTLTISIEPTTETTIDDVRAKFATAGNLDTLRLITEDGTEVTKKGLKLLSVSEFISDDRHTYSVRLAYKAA